MVRQTLGLIVLAALLLSACGGGTTAPAATAVSKFTPSPIRSAQVSELENTVEARASSDAEWEAASEGTEIPTGGGVRTGEDARAKVAVTDGTILRLAPNTELELSELSPAITDPVTKITLAAGKLWTVVTGLGNGGFEIESPSGVATVRGSFMSVEFYPINGQMIATCLEGLCRLTGRRGVFTDLRTGQQSGIPGFDEDPTPPKDLDIRQLEDWQDNFPEAQDIVVTITPGPEPTETTTPPGGGSGATGGYASQTACDNPYFPLRAGTEWTYTSSIGPMVWRVDSVTGDTNNATAQMTSVFSGFTTSYTWECTAQNGLVSYDFGVATGNLFPGAVTLTTRDSSGAFLPPADLLVPGYSWNNNHTLNAEATLEGQTVTMVSEHAEQFTVGEAQTVTIDGQEYEAITVTGNSTSQMTTSMAGVTMPSIETSATSTFVYARGVGITAWTSVSTSNGESTTTTFELTSFTAPTGR